MSAAAKLPPSVWSQKRALCLDCRVTLPAGTRCPQPDHQTIDLASDSGLDVLDHSRWDRTLDQLDRRHRARRVVTALALWLGCAVLMVIMTQTRTATVTLATMVFVAGMLPAAVLVAWGKLLMSSFRDSEQRPLGASAPPPFLLTQRRVIGRVVDGDSHAAPLSGRSCVAYGVWLHHSRARPSSLVVRDSSSQRIKILGDDGDMIEIPPGTIELRGVPTVSEVAQQDVQDYLACIGLLGGRGESRIEFDEIRDLHLRIGDRVVVHGKLRRELDPGGGPATYRDSAATRMVPIDIAAIERIE